MADLISLGAVLACTAALSAIAHVRTQRMLSEHRQQPIGECGEWDRIITHFGTDTI